MLRTDPLANPEALIRRVYRYVAYRIGDGPEAEDVTSDTFERALRYRNTYDRRKGEPVGWILGIARRCVDHHLGARTAISIEVPDVATQGDLEMDALRRLEIRRAVATLGDRERDLVALRYGADLTAPQIAEMLDMKTNAVEVALHRALGRLRVALQSDGQEEAAPIASSAL